ncbi:hypothetical protein [Chromobacterium sp. LK11]|uniref:hypothetical protein n=1 Tax=Chromobacterium sp. LK11 TaxID=1628212 RepID=UPI000B23EF3B|nr:hypothetical protein [Chromobacterium sp. LK11]
MSDTVTYGRSRSAGTSTTSGASGPEYKIEYRGYYQVNQRHELESPLKKSLDMLEAAAARFATDVIKDANVRISYQENIKRMAQTVLDEVNAGRVSAKDGMEFSYAMRNKIMAEHRVVTSAQGLAIAERHKLEPPTIKELLDKKAKSLFGRQFDLLTPAEKNKVYYAIIESSAKPNQDFNVKAKKLGVIGKVGWVVTAALASYAVTSSENKTKETIKQGAVIGGGLAGGVFAGLAVSTLCGPGAPVCAVAVVLAGSVVGGALAESVVDNYDEELEEFTKWRIQ